MGDKKHGIDKQLIRELAELLSETDLSEIEVEQNDFRIRVTRAAQAAFAPVAADDLAGIGRTNDAILYGGRVHLWVTGDDESLESIGPQVPS